MDRRSDPNGPPPGSLVVMYLIERSSRIAVISFKLVDLPEPSIPSRVINLPSSYVQLMFLKIYEIHYPWTQNIGSQ